jgi:hypothetical protein
LNGNLDGPGALVVADPVLDVRVPAVAVAVAVVAVAVAVAVAVLDDRDLLVGLVSEGRLKSVTVVVAELELHTGVRTLAPDDPPAAVEQAIGFVEAVAERHGVPHPFQGTVATTKGESIWASRYSSEGTSRQLFYTTDVPTLRKQQPERQILKEFSEDARLIVSEPSATNAGFGFVAMRGRRPHLIVTKSEDADVGGRESCSDVARGQPGYRCLQPRRDFMGGRGPRSRPGSRRGPFLPEGSSAVARDDRNAHEPAARPRFLFT